MDVVMVGVLAGGLIRVGEMVAGGPLPLPGTIAAGVELTFPLLWWVSSASMRRERVVTVERARTSTASALALWEVFHDFGGVGDWHPYMESAHLDPGPSQGVGAARTCRFGPRMAIRETVREWRVQAMVIGIDFLEGPPSPLHDVVAAVRTEALADGARLVLTMRFRTRWGPLGTLMEPLVVHQYTQVFERMLDAATRYAEQGATVPPVVMPMSGRRLA